MAPSRQAAFFGPTVANGALRTWLDLAVCPARSPMTHDNRRMAPSKRACIGPGSTQLFLFSRLPALILIAAPFSSRLSRYSRYNHEAAKWLKVGYSNADRKRMTKRAWAGGSEHFWIYVHEHGRYEGFHTHQLCVVPPDKATAFWQCSLACFARLTGQYRIHPDAVCFSPCTRSRGFEPYRGKNELDGVARCWDWFRYLVKSLGHDWCVPDDQKVLHPARDIFKPYPFVNTAEVHCAKLAGGSENIRKKAQVAAGFRSKHLKGEFDRLYDGSELEERRRRLENEAYEKEMEIIRKTINFD